MIPDALRRQWRQVSGSALARRRGGPRKGEEVYGGDNERRLPLMQCKFAIPVVSLIIAALPAAAQSPPRADVEARVDALWAG